MKGWALSVGLIAGATILLAGCSTDAGSTPAQQLSSWASTAQLGSSIATAEADDARIGRLVADHASAKELRTACIALVTDLSNGAAGDLPAPDSLTSDDLAAAFKDEAAAGENCVSGSGGDAAAMARSLHEQAQGEELFAAALDRVALVTGHPLSTATTAPAADAGGD